MEWDNSFYSMFEKRYLPDTFLKEIDLYSEIVFLFSSVLISSMKI
ncbi:hypothetical protein LEP1GSC188_4812 [Leptospira weilii serovar Topaz str. LT2116]|uniref:Uncharacterized protein n=1 Tax=Leptospira weilii serovar Topaz str. LT2116 TaxID=1088540 RepID=M3EMX2_9LEPT|nr:hypothetical protein LEP1GSC188_4812 [Leptospira weilii serovar Topaz str. LT2116]